MFLLDSEMRPVLQRPTYYTTSSNISTLSLLSFQRCFAVVQALTTPFVDVQTFDNISPAEYTTILSHFSEQKRDRLLAKLIYLPDNCKLVAMAPYRVHEVPLQHLRKRTHKLLMRLLLDDDQDVSWTTHFNLAIVGENQSIIPDFHLDLRPLHHPGAPAIPFWVGESGFSSTQTYMERQLELAANVAPDMDLALMVSIREASMIFPSRTHELHTRPLLPRSAFTPTMPPSALSLEPVVVQGITWIDINSITLHVFLRGPDGTFDFKEKGNLYTHGSIYPELEMAAVDNMLNEAVKRLVLKFVRMMEEVQADPTKITRLLTESETATFPSDWTLFRRDFLNSLYDTAYTRYCWWRNAVDNKRKEENLPRSGPDPLNKRPALSIPSPSIPPQTATQVAEKSTRKKKGKKVT